MTCMIMGLGSKRKKRRKVNAERGDLSFYKQRQGYFCRGVLFEDCLPALVILEFFALLNAI